MEMVKKMKIFQCETNGTTPKTSKKQRRSRKPKFELGKPKKGYDNKKKDKKKKIKEEIATLLGKFHLIFARIRACNRRLKQLISEVDAHVLDQLKSWEDEDKGF